jgi:HEAT repeat protein
MKRLALLASLVASTSLAQDASPALRRALTVIDSPPTRGRLVEAGGRETPMVLRALASSTPEPLGLRRAALSALGHFDEPATRATLGLLTRDAEPVVRKGAVETLAFLARGQAEPSLVRALSDEVPMVRRAAVRALARSQDVAAREALDGLWRTEADAETRALLRQALKR